MQAIKIKKAKDQNDLLLEGTLPLDVEDDVEPMHARSAIVVRTQDREPFDRERPLPSDVYAEAALLGALLWYGAYSPGTVTLGTVRDVVDKAEVFFLPAHRAIYAAIEELHKAGTAPDPVAVHGVLARMRVERAIGGMEYLQRLVGAVTNTNDVKLRHYADTVREMWIRRRLIETGVAVQALARNGQKGPQEIAEEANALMTAVARSAYTSGNCVSLAVVLANVVREMMHGTSTALPTGFRDLDEATGGLFAKETTILGARTSVGKSTLAAQIAMHIASLPRKAVLYITLEMPAESFIARFAATCARVSYGRIRRKTLTADEASRILTAASEIRERPLYFASSRTQTLLGIHTMAWQLASKLALQGIKLALVVIDSVGLVKPSAAVARGTREHQVAETSRGLGWLAEDLNCHVMGIAHVKRDWSGSKDDDAVPQISDLRESGALEQDADNVWMLHRKFNKRGMPVPDVPAYLAYAKARNDSKAFLKLDCEPEFCRFGDWEGER